MENTVFLMFLMLGNFLNTEAGHHLMMIRDVSFEEYRNNMVAELVGMHNARVKTWKELGSGMTVYSEAQAQEKLAFNYMLIRNKLAEEG